MHKIKLGQSKSSTIEMNEDRIFTVKLFMGKFSPMDVMLDTSFDWLMIEGRPCEECEENKYDIERDLEDGLAKMMTSQAYPIQYNSVNDSELIVSEYETEVCLLFSACVPNFHFMLIEAQNGDLSIREPVDGIMGLARKKDYHHPHFQENESLAETRFVEALVEEGIISESTFSIALSWDDSLSTFDVG